jgi:ComF family protein
MPQLTQLLTATLTQIRQVTHCLLPSQCLLCASPSGNNLLCIGCHMDLPYTAHRQLCQQCGLQLESLSLVCGHCLTHPPAFARCIIPFAYEYPLDALIHRFKYRRHLTSGKLLSQLLAEYLKHHAQADADWHTPDLLIPAPMHWLRRWQRGFNQAEVLAQHLAHQLHIPLATQIVQRTHKTPAQKELTRTERQQNLRKAFMISAKNCTHIQGKRIALIDDVVTTTATVRELSQLLINAGAKDVQVWALARTM